jgi:LEA14-like dessication related protein
MASYKLYRFAFYILSVVLIGSCATLQTEFKEPTVSVTSFRALPSKGMAPRFEIGLHVTNPNRVALALEGLSYSVNIEGHQLLTGVANDLPVIEGYGEGDITLLATADLFNSISLISDLMRQPRDSFNYEIIAKLDLGGMYPDIPVKKQGQISLAPVAR